MITMPTAKATAPGLIAAAGNAEGPRYRARFVTIRQAPKPSQKLRRPILVALARHRHCRTNWMASMLSQASKTIRSSTPAEWVSKYGFITRLEERRVGK